MRKLVASHQLLLFMKSKMFIEPRHWIGSVMIKRLFDIKHGRHIGFPVITYDD